MKKSKVTSNCNLLNTDCVTKQAELKNYFMFTNGDLTFSVLRVCDDKVIVKVTGSYCNNEITKIVSW